MIQSVRGNIIRKSLTEAGATTAIETAEVIGQGIETEIMDTGIGIAVITEVTAIVRGIGVMSGRMLEQGPMTLQSILIGMYLEGRDLERPRKSGRFVSHTWLQGNTQTPTLYLQR